MIIPRRAKRLSDYRSILDHRGEVEIGVQARRRRWRNLFLAIVGAGMIVAAGWLFHLLQPPEETGRPPNGYTIKIQCTECGYTAFVYVKYDQRFPLICPRCKLCSFRQVWHCKIDGCRVRFASLDRIMKGGFNRDRGFGPELEGLGVVLGGSGNVIRDSIVAYCIGDGISAYGRDNRIENCVIHDCDISASDCAPINCTGTGHRIIGCTMYNAGRSGIVHRKLRHGRIERDMGCEHQHFDAREREPGHHRCVHDPLR